jgi:LAS superfamily LD-carboxypeptidase LdcB
MHMKKLIAAMAILLAVSPAFAQTTAPKQAPAPATTTAPKALPAPEKRAVAYTDELKAKLHLTDDQYQKVLAVNTECIRRKDALKASGQKDGPGHKEISAYRKQQFQTILTPDQLTQLKALNAQNTSKKSVE